MVLPLRVHQRAAGVVPAQPAQGVQHQRATPAPASRVRVDRDPLEVAACAGAPGDRVGRRVPTPCLSRRVCPPPPVDRAAVGDAEADGRRGAECLAERLLVEPPELVERETVEVEDARRDRRAMPAGAAARSAAGRSTGSRRCRGGGAAPAPRSRRRRTAACPPAASALVTAVAVAGALQPLEAASTPRRARAAAPSASTTCATSARAAPGRHRAPIGRCAASGGRPSAAPRPASVPGSGPGISGQRRSVASGRAARRRRSGVRRPRHRSRPPRARRPGSTPCRGASPPPGVDDALVPLAPRDATRAELERVHDAGAARSARRRSPPPAAARSTPTPRCPRGRGAPRCARPGRASPRSTRWPRARARPPSSRCARPGTTRRRRGPMGFCLLNNVAVTAAALAERGERVLVVDYDAHHGNGTQDVFWTRPRVLYVSLHEWPLYPGTGASTTIGAGAGEGATCNVPLPAGATGDVYLARDRRGGRARWPRRSAPTWVLVSAASTPTGPTRSPGSGSRAGDYGRARAPGARARARAGPARRLPRGGLRPRGAARLDRGHGARSSPAPRRTPSRRRAPAGPGTAPSRTHAAALGASRLGA